MLSFNTNNILEIDATTCEMVILKLQCHMRSAYPDSDQHFRANIVCMLVMGGEGLTDYRNNDKLTETPHPAEVIPEC